MKTKTNKNITASIPQRSDVTYENHYSEWHKLKTGRCSKKKETVAGFAMASLLVTLAYAPMPAEAEILSVPKLTVTARSYKGTNTNISDYNSVTALETGINQLRRNEEAIMKLCPNSIATLDLPDQATWNGYNADQKALLIVNEERRARGGVIYLKPKRQLQVMLTMALREPYRATPLAVYQK